MQMTNSTDNYGLVARALHWVMALAIVAMFASGLWIVELSLYDSWYKTGPWLHQGFGIVLAALLVVRIGWRLANVTPDDSYLKPIEQHASHLVHLALYAILAVVFVSGYLITSVDGRPIDLFGWFSVPSLYQQKGLEDLAGEVHEKASFLIIGLALFHTAGALKHHFIDRDITLSRMWRGKAKS